MTMALKRIGVLTGGGDAPGLNPAIRAVVGKAAELDIEVVGVYDGWRGLLDENKDGVWPLDPDLVRYWDTEGGTRLGSSRSNPFNHQRDGKRVDASDEVLAHARQYGLDALVAIGGEDTLGVATRMHKKGLPVVGIPKTIDKDLGGTDYTLGFDTSLRICADIIERSRTPAGSHNWVQVVEVMGRHAGHLALWSGLAGGAYMTLIPEAPFELERVFRLLDERLSRGLKDRRLPRYAVVVVAEGAMAAGGKEVTVDNKVDSFGHARLGGIGAWLAEQIRAHSGWDSRSVALGHPQRGGSPSPVDRLMGHLFGTAAVEACQMGAWGQLVAARGSGAATQIHLVPLETATKGLNLVDVARHYDLTRYTHARRVLG
jgi:6-phosphofructokinase 1